MNAPRIDLTNPTNQVDTDGKKWLTALVKPDGEIMAGRDEYGNFRAFADIEEIYDHSIAVMHYMTQQP